MLRLPTLLLLALILLGCLKGGEDPAAYETDIAPASAQRELEVQTKRSFVNGEYIGLIEAGSSAATIENLYGGENFVSQEVDVGEGMTENGYVLFPESRDELLIRLNEDKQPATATFSHPRSRWQEETTGISIGTTLKELRRLNGKPFTFYGFEWDYGGTIANWNGGKLNGLLLRLQYAPERIPPDGLAPELIGDHTVSSESKAAVGLGITVREVVVDIE